MSYYIYLELEAIDHYFLIRTIRILLFCLCLYVPSLAAGLSKADEYLTISSSN